MLYVMALIDGVTFGFFWGNKIGSFWVGLFTAIAVMFVFGALGKVYQVLSSGLWGYLLYTWLIHSQPEYKVVSIIAITIAVRVAIYWLQFKYDESLHQYKPNFNRQEKPFSFEEDSIGAKEEHVPYFNKSDVEQANGTSNVTHFQPYQAKENKQVVNFKEWISRKNSK